MDRVYKTALPNRRRSSVRHRTNEADLTAKNHHDDRGGIDRRVARTRAQLHEALLALLAERDYTAITVEDICERANVGRSTFYGHYTGKDDLIRSGMKRLRTTLLENQRAAAASKDRAARLTFSLAMAEHARDHAPLHRGLAGGRGGTIVFEAIHDMLSDVVRAELAAGSGKKRHEEVPQELVVQYVVGAYMAVLTWWLDGKARLAPEHIEAMFRRLTLDGVRGLRG
jgi:AcrR family transcriptional regulator